MHNVELGLTRKSHTFTYLAIFHTVAIIASISVSIFFGLHGALVLAAPSTVIMCASIQSGPIAVPRVTARQASPRALEGDTIDLHVTIAALVDCPLVDVEFEPNEKLAASGSTRALFSLAAGHETTHVFHVIVDEWGVVRLGGIEVRIRDRFGLRLTQASYEIVGTMRVHIHEETVRSLTDPDRFRRLVGSHQSPERNEGCEIADVRQYQPGDRLQSINWRISARNDEPWITLRHPDRSTNIVLLLDAYQRFGSQRDGSLRRSVRATLGIARLHLDSQDPVGLMIVGNGMRWFAPELGRLHLHRLTDALLDLSTLNWSEHHQSDEALHRMIPADAVVIAVSTLADRRFVRTLMSLRARGQSVQVIEPVTYWPAHIVAVRHGAEFVPELSWRVFSLQQQVKRAELASAGISVVPWEESQPFESVMLGMRMTRHARRAEMRS